MDIKNTWQKPNHVQVVALRGFCTLLGHIFRDGGVDFNRDAHADGALTALQAAVLQGNKDKIESIEHGANINTPAASRGGITAQDICLDRA